MRLVALLLVIPVLAGCLSDGPSDSPITVQQAWDLVVADAAVAGGDIVAVGAVEHSSSELRETIRESGDPTAKAMFHVYDQAPGDGRAPRWAAVFVQDGSLQLIVVGAGGRVHLSDPEPVPDELNTMFAPMVRPGIDSDEVAARFDNATWIAYKQASHTIGNIDYGKDVASFSLFSHNEMMSGDQGAGFTYWVDPNNGTILGINVPLGVDVDAELGSVSLVAQVNAPATDSFVIMDDHSKMALRLANNGFFGNPADRTQPGHDLKAVVRDPLGQEFTITWTTPALPFGPGGGTSSEAIIVEPVWPGEWTVTLSVEQGVRSGARLQYCTTGEREMGGGVGGNVCNAIE